ncbi:hypothetical protein SynBIOSU31_02681 [Synechococcus sp. BIOS-U3-1]|nr:hypothetical protein SynBIOSU31_02681 [Synechococcus sp. BIOS-U3-1]
MGFKRSSIKSYTQKSKVSSNPTSDLGMHITSSSPTHPIRLALHN